MISFEQLVQEAVLLRKEYQEECEGFHWTDVPVGKVEEQYISAVEGGSPTRILIYSPQTSPAKSGLLPLYVSIHGGAFIRGSADFDDYFCRKTANEACCKVINIDFKLAPEYKFPYSVEECYRVVAWAQTHASQLGIDPERIGVGGHNSGATIAAVVAQLARDRGLVKLKCMLLDGPVVSLVGDTHLEDFVVGQPLAGPQKGAFFNTCYLGDLSNAQLPMASPACLTDLTGLPDALILTAGEDPLTPATRQYAMRLLDAGVDVEYICMAGCKHGFTVRAGLSDTKSFDTAWATMNTYLLRKLSDRSFSPG